MPRYNVEADGQWACFSSVVDAFITPFMPLADYEEWRDKEYGSDKAPLKFANKMTLKDALFRLSINKSEHEILECMREAGLFWDRKYRGNGKQCGR